MILTYELPGGSWPGEQEVRRLGFEGCEQRLDTWFRHRPKIEDGVPYILFPTKVSWWARNRTVHCAIAREEGKFTAPIDMSAPAPGIRQTEELNPGDCFQMPDATTVDLVTLAECGVPHTGQVTHVFTLPDGQWPGASKVKKLASGGCQRRWDTHFGEHPTKRRLEQWYLWPQEAGWRTHDRTVHCYVTAQKGKLTGSVM
jgi:hypothetical protein